MSSREDEIHKCKCKSCGHENQDMEKCVSTKCVCCYNKDTKQFDCQEIKYSDE